MSEDTKITVKCYNIIWDVDAPEEDCPDEVEIEVEWDSYGDELNPETVDDIIYNEMEWYCDWLYDSCDYTIIDSNGDEFEFDDDGNLVKIEEEEEE